jgi:predicted amidohydrolase
LEATITRQAAAAFADGCFAAVWPELTMPPDARQALARQLAFEALRHGPDRPLRLVVAGSWHEPREEGGWSNLARILGRTGEVLCSYAKFSAFHDEAWGEEAILRGDELPVVVTGDLVVGLAICKDFCDRAVASPFADLPVDLILVPSMGRASTLAGHLANAENLRLRTGTIVFVVQQLPGTTANPAQAGGEILGHVLLSRRKATAVPQASTWAVHVASPAA